MPLKLVDSTIIHYWIELWSHDRFRNEFKSIYNRVDRPYFYMCLVHEWQFWICWWQVDQWGNCCFSHAKTDRCQHDYKHIHVDSNCVFIYADILYQGPKNIYMHGTCCGKETPGTVNLCWHNTLKCCSNSDSVHNCQHRTDIVTTFSDPPTKRIYIYIYISFIEMLSKWFDLYVICIVCQCGWLFLACAVWFYLHHDHSIRTSV